jgi:Kelch motif protein/kelch motif-containing protein
MPRPERGRSGTGADGINRLNFIPLGLIGAALILVPLSAVVEFPGEERVKGWFGVEYIKQGCGPIRDRGQGGGWRREPSLPGARESGSATRVGNGVFIAGGLSGKRFDEARSEAAFERFDLRTRRYERLPSLPERLNHEGLGTYRGDVYMVGGAGDRIDPFFATSSFWRYRVGTRRWERLPPMPTARAGLGTATIGHRFFAVGGTDHVTGVRGASQHTNEAYDFTTGRWSELAPMPTARDHLGVASLGGFLYAVGGRSPDGNNQRAFERYDPRSDRWERLRPPPISVSGVQLLPVGGRLVLAGGESPAKGWLTGATQAYDPRTGAWRRLPSMPIPLHGYAASVAGSRLYLFGGGDCAGYSAVRTAESYAVGRR